MLIKVFPGLASKVDQICQISKSYVLRILSYAQKTFFLHINEETLALSHLSAFERVVSGALKNGVIDEEEFNMLQTLHLETLNELTGVDHRMEAEHRSQVEKA